MNVVDIYLKNAFLHIIDREGGDPVFSQVELDLSTAYIRDYLTKKIQKISSAQTKTGKLIDHSVMAGLIQSAPQDFPNFSQQLVTRWYDIYKQSEDAPSADVFIVLFEEDTKLQVAFLKINFTEAYTHFVDSQELGITNQLIINRAILGGKSQKPDEGITIDIENLTFELIEKKYSFSGEKRSYLSSQVFDSEPVASLDENVKVIKKVAEKIGKKFETPTYDVVAEVKEAVFDTINKTGTITSKEVAEKVFKDNVTAKLAFEEEVQEKGYVDQAPLLKEVKEITEKKYSKQKLKLSNGIEMTVPLEVYRNPELIEFVNNPDGTISVMIKNVEEVINRL